MKMYASGDKGKQEESSKIELVSDFNTMTYDGPFKKVFAIKRILAIVIKETIGLYKDCTLSDIIGLIESVAPGPDTGQNYGSDKITISESYVNGEGTVKFDLLVKAGVPAQLIEKAGCKYVQIRLDLEMQRDSSPGYPLTFRGLYYGSRLVNDQIPKISKNTDYSVLIPVYSIWITLVGKNTDAANKVLRYKLQNTGYNHADSPDSFTGRMNTVTDLLNIYLICIDKSILESRIIDDNLEPVVEFISLLFAGLFKDSRLKKHDIEFKGVADKYGEELEDMAKYYSEVEEIVAEEAARAAAEGKAEGIINMSLEFGKDKGFIIGSLTKKLNISTEKAEEYYKMFSK
jgi:hypothetical protein